MGREQRGERDLPPGSARDLVDLYRRLRSARKLSGGQIAVRTGLSAGYVSEVMRGWKCPHPDTAARIAVALGASTEEVRRVSRLAGAAADLNRYNRGKGRDLPPRPLAMSELRRYRVTGIPSVPDRFIGVAGGDIRRVRCADVWVNPENTDMQMARFNEFSVSSIIRYEGAVHDELGRVTDDCIAAELAWKVADRRPVPPASTIVTTSGELKRYGVNHIVHVAAVHGEPGAGYRQVHEVGRCVTNVMTAVDNIDGQPHTVLCPLLGAGQGRAKVEDTVSALAGAAIDYFSSAHQTHIETMFFLAYTDAELKACDQLLSANERLILPG
jgi:transcriptional regulator with XRE-family HTH domain